MYDVRMTRCWLKQPPKIILGPELPDKLPQKQVL